MNKRFLVPILFLVFSIVSYLLIVVGEHDKEHAKIIIRFDDYGIWCNDKWVDLEKRLIDLHSDYDVKISFSVVPNSIYPAIYHPKSLNIYPHEKRGSDNPFPLKPGTNRVEYLKEASKKNIVEVGQHGYHHPKYYSNIKNGEFNGYDYDTQFKKIQEGKSLLDSLFEQNTILFVPPHNSYDNLTLDVLSESGFEIISAKDPSPNSPVDDAIPLSYFPYTTESFQSLANKYNDNDGWTGKGAPMDVLLIHHTSFTNEVGEVSQDKIKEYEDFLSLIQSKGVVSYRFCDIFRNKEISKENDIQRRKLYNKISLLSESFALKVLESGLSYKAIVLLLSLYIFVFSLLFFSSILFIFNRPFGKIIPSILLVILFGFFLILLFKNIQHPFNQSIVFFTSKRFWLLLVAMGAVLASVLYKQVIKSNK